MSNNIVRLAESFLIGKLYFTSIPAHLHDTAAFGQRHYWPLGPFARSAAHAFRVIFSVDWC